MFKRTHITFGVAAMTLAVASFAAPAATAQQASYTAEFERPFGADSNVLDNPFDISNSAGSRDLSNNRLIINGLLNGGSSLGQGLNTGWGQTQGAAGMLGSHGAIGNQLNVVTNGSNNTIIIDNSQINNGDQTVILNGGLDLND